jgi:hypothetical protein
MMGIPAECATKQKHKFEVKSTDKDATAKIEIWVFT